MRGRHNLCRLALLAACFSGCRERSDLKKSHDSPIQPIVADLQTRAVTLRSIDTGDEDFRDLEPLRAALGEARVVVLGEGSHGDGSAFLAKTRLMKFLYQRMGFDVLVWESAFYGCYAAWLDGTSDQKRGILLEEAVLPIWGGSRECKPAFEFIRATWGGDRPMAFVGLSSYVAENVPVFDDQIRFFEKSDAGWPTAEQKMTLRSLQKASQVDTPRPADRMTPPQEEHLRAMQKLLEGDATGKTGKWQGDKEALLARQTLENLVEYARMLHRPPSRGGIDDNPWCEQEGRNLLFWAQRYFADRKLIVWAHSGHFLRNAKTAVELGRSFGIPDLRTAGDVLHRELGHGAYVIVSLSYDGLDGLWWDTPRPLPLRDELSLEARFHEAGLRTAFLNLRGLPEEHWLQAKQVASPIAHQPLQAIWPRCYDGVLFVDRAAASTER